MANIDVYVNKKVVGRLTKTGEKHVFSYRHHAQEALSLTMPIRTESYSYQGLHPIFQMNLPEGDLRQAIERTTAKLYGSDDLTVMSLLGNNQIGRMAYTIAEQALSDQEDAFPDLSSLLGSNDASLFDQLLTRFATRSGVAGVQPKVLLDVKIEQLLSVEAKASLPFHSYIVKSWGHEYPELGCNEYFSLMLARYAGLQVADFYLSDNGRLLITKRFDLDPQGKQLGFEDFCVLQGKNTREKYDASLESCTNTIRQYVSPQFQRQALSDFFKLTLVNWKLCNGDAHLKNSGVLYENLENFHIGEYPQAERQLAPVFDLVSTIPYIQNDTMALSLTGSKRWPKWKVLQQFGKQHCGLSNKEIKQSAEQVEQACQDSLSILRQLSAKHYHFGHIAEKMEIAVMRPF